MARRPGFGARGWAAVLFLLALGGAGVGPASAQKPVLTPSDYARWERLGGFGLDPTGMWLVAAVSRVDETRELRLHAIDRASEVLVLEHASAPVFSPDGRWLAYRKGISPEEREAAEEPVADRLGLVALEGARDSVLFDVSSFAFRDDGAWLAARGVAPSDSVGADVVVLNPATGARTLIGNVNEFSWQDEGGLLAATLRTAWGSGNGVVLFDPDAGTLRTLDARDAEYRALTWRDGSDQLAVLRSVESAGDEEESHDVLVWGDARSGGDPAVLEGAVGAGDARAHRITEHAGITFGDEGRTVFVGVRPWERRTEGDGAEDADAGEEEAEADDGPDPADVQVWHWDDDEIIRAQEYRADAIARRTLAAAWRIAEDRLVILADDLQEPVTIVDGGRWGVVPDHDPYRFERRFGSDRADWYRVDVRTGERERIGQGLEFGLVTHEDRGWALAYRDDRWWSVDLESLAWQELAAGRSFTRALADYDYPGPRPSWGAGGWVDREDAALVYDKHDVWRVDLRDGDATRVTRGAEEGRQYRLVALDPEAPRSGGLVERVEGAVLSVRDLRSKESGYARVAGNGAVDELVFEHARVGGLVKARDAERFAFRRERWDDPPDVVVTGSDFRDPRPMVETNPFQDDYAWGRSELLSYTTDAGHDLQAVLVYPAGFEEGGRYPLILYQYERLSDNLHAYSVPSERSYYNQQAWSQAGYFVLMPDIVYEPGRPGPSALDAVEHALDAAVATGHVDPARMGLIGHSWGGYQASYLPTRTDRFAASVAGAAITNFLSFMGAVHWNGGLPETGHWETGQARMAVPYWEDLEGHLESSPASFVADLDTPMLLMHGDRDGVVDFYQGLEFYNYARRAGKEVVLLVYPGADHGLSDEAQQVDYHRRILEWFGHYLKGDEAADWITKGESWVERERRLGG